MTEHEADVPVDRSLEGSEAMSEETIAPIIQQSQAAFLRDLGALLKNHEGDWVAYHGDKQLGFAGSETELYKRCLREYKDGQFVVRSVEPQIEDEDVFSDRPVEIFLDTITETDFNKVLNDLRNSLTKHPDPHAEYIIIDGKDYSPAKLLQEIADQTLLGRELVRNHLVLTRLKAEAEQKQDTDSH